MDFPIKDMIDCFIKAGREDLVSVLELIFEELLQVYEDDTDSSISDSDIDEEDIEVQVDDNGFMSLK